MKVFSNEAVPQWLQKRLERTERDIVRQDIDGLADGLVDELATVIERLEASGECPYRRLARLVRLQLALPRQHVRDGRFLLNLEHALRDLAVRAPVLPGAAS